MVAGEFGDLVGDGVPASSRQPRLEDLVKGDLVGSCGTPLGDPGQSLLGLPGQRSGSPSSWRSRMFSASTSSTRATPARLSAAATSSPMRRSRSRSSGL
jgi:hypothetical protein